MSGYVKWNDHHKFDAHQTKSEDFLHEVLSDKQDNFHSTYAYYHGSINGYHGIQKTAWRASGHGFCIDSKDVGKSNTKCPN